MAFDRIVQPNEQPQEQMHDKKKRALDAAKSQQAVFDDCDVQFKPDFWITKNICNIQFRLPRCSQRWVNDSGLDNCIHVLLHLLGNRRAAEVWALQPSRVRKHHWNA